MKKKTLEKNPDHYVEMRLRIGTMMQEERDKGEWVDIILPEHKEWLDLNSLQRAEDLRYYTQVGLENHLRSYAANLYDVGLTPKKIPLQTPMSTTIISEHREVLGQIQD